MIYSYTDNMDVCPVCDRKIKMVAAIGYCLMGPPSHARIAYPLCSPCAKKAARGLNQTDLAALDRRLDVRAVQLGLVRTEGAS